jgi:hypothetical protein
VAAKKKTPLSKFERSIIETEGLRVAVAPDKRALFDHCIVLARDSHKHGYAKRGGQELAHARKLATSKYGGKL